MNEQTEQTQRIKIVGFDTDADIAQAINDLAVDMTDEEAEAFKAELKAEQKDEDWDSFIDKARLKVKLRAKLEAKKKPPLIEALIMKVAWTVFWFLSLMLIGGFVAAFIMPL